jgi:hypothetical protein
MIITRRRRVQPGEETPFIEVLFVAVGTLAMLMLVFLAAATRPAPAPACERAGLEDEVGLAAEIGEWAAATRSVLARSAGEVGRRCRFLPEQTKSLLGMFPAKLASYCKSDQDRVIARTGLKREELEQLGNRLQTAIATAADCMAQQLVEPRGCVATADGDVATAAAGLKTWADAARTEATVARAEINKHCVRQPAPSEPPTHAMLPADLMRYCSAGRDQIVDKAGLTWDQLQALGREQQETARAAYNCLSTFPVTSSIVQCPALSAEELARNANSVSVWLDEEARTRAALRDAAKRLCGDSYSLASLPPPSSTDLLLPPILYGFCARQVEQILAQARRTRAELANASRERRSLNTAIVQCASKTESITLDSTNVRFNVCSVEPNAAPGFFRTLAHNVAERVGSHNRIDILGHSDSTPISKDGCRAMVTISGKRTPVPYQVYTNEMLSWLRANAVRDALMISIDEEGLYDFAERLKEDKENRVRIYTIGVGSAEGLSTKDESRRIEIRFATDSRIVSKAR